MSQNAPSGGNAVNLKTSKKAPKHRSDFDLSYRFANTIRYGFASPFFKFEGIPGDKVSLRSAHTLRSMSLKSPLFQNLRMNKDFYAVPMKALLPFNWDKVFNNPVQGDDINPQLVNTVVKRGTKTGDNNRNFLELISQAINGCQAWYSAASLTVANVPTLLRMCLYANIFFSRDSLFNVFRINLWGPARKLLVVSPEKFNNAAFEAYNAFCESIVNQMTASGGLLPFTVDFLADDGTVDFSKSYDLSKVKDRMRFFYDFCENPYVTVPTYAETVVNYTTAATAAKEAIDNALTQAAGTATTLKTFIDNLKTTATSAEIGCKYINLAPIYAYQMIMAEYFSNDKIDFVYNSDMFRQVIQTYGTIKDFGGSSIDGTFTWNGKRYQYDAFSNFSVSTLVYNALYRVTKPEQVAAGVSLIYALFGYKRNLKYVDYFTGCRTRPVAIGDLNVAVGDSGVDIIDITQKIQKQRFLNQVNRIGPDAKNYLKGIFGVEERQHIDVPVKIGHIDETIYGEEVQNTADAQQTQPNSITTNLNSRGSNFAFEFKISESTIVLGLVSFSIRRFYNHGEDPFDRKVDRFDMFNPYLQFVGDQPIYLSELSRADGNDEIFGYTGRYAEYKNSVDYACGDFLDTLNSWIFSDGTPEEHSATSPKHVDPDFIRQDPTELDDFYLNFTGTRPEDRYHFIVVFDNKVSASRDMVFNPQILG